jgi:hypothetical protein
MRKKHDEEAQEDPKKDGDMRPFHKKEKPYLS